NSLAEPQRFDATKARITARLIGRYVDRERALAAVTLNGATQKMRPTSETKEARHSYWSPPKMRAVNWTRANTFVAVQEWEGVVESITPDHIVASLVDLTAGKNRATETAEIPLAEINERDIEKLGVGRVFRWAVGYLRLKSGTRKRISNIVFRDIPQWTKTD